jgi:acetyl esterase/lipase
MRVSVSPRRAGGVVLLALALGATSACSLRRAAELVFLGDQFELTRDLPYGAGARQRLDVYRPRAAARPAPVIVFLYGGRWQSGSKDEYRLLGDALTRRGVVAVVPDYRLYPEVRFPAWVEDGARAVRWVRDNIARFGGDPARIFVAGHSAGAHTVALLALDGHYLRDAGVPAGAVRGFVSLAGPVATTWTAADVRALMGPREGWPATYPATHVGAKGPPLLLLHGSKDRTVSVENSVRLAARLRERGACARLRVYPGVSHIGIIVALAIPRLGIAPVLDDVMAFVRRPAAGACGAASRPAVDAAGGARQ